MMGIAGLPQGSNMPMGRPAPGQAMPMGMGQPPMPGMKPPAGGTPAGVAALTPSLAQMNKQQLLMEFMNPASKVPKYALISAIDEKAKQEKAMAAVQGSLAQQEAQQQPGTVTQEVLQSAMQPVMARHGGAMHSYRQGGIVGYANGTPPEGAQSYPVIDQREVERILRKAPMARTQEENDLLRSAGVQLEQRRLGDGTINRIEEGLKKVPFNLRQYLTEGAQTLGPEELAERKDTGAITERVIRALGGQQMLPTQQQAPQESMDSEIQRMMGQSTGEARYGEMPASVPRSLIAQPTTFDITSPSSINALRMAAQDTSLPESERADLRDRIAMMERSAPQAAPQVRPPAAPAAPAATTTDPMLEARLKELAERGKVPADVQAGREGIASLVKADMEARQRRMEQDRADALRRREEMAKSAPGVLDPEGLLRMASMIDPSRKGTAFRGISRGAAEILAGQRAARQGAEKEYQEFQRLQRAEENALSQMRIAEAQRRQAEISGDATALRQAQDAVYSTRMEFDKTRQERQDKQRQLAALEMQAEAAKTQAGRESETDRKIRLAKEDPALFSQMYGPKDKDLAFPALKAQADLIAERLKDPLLDANQKTALTAEYNKIMGALSRLSGVGGMSSPPLYAVNPKTKERIVSTDGGATWNPAK